MLGKELASDINDVHLGLLYFGHRIRSCCGATKLALFDELHIYPTCVQVEAPSPVALLDLDGDGRGLAQA